MSHLFCRESHRAQTILSVMEEASKTSPQIIYGQINDCILGCEQCLQAYLLLKKADCFEKERILFRFSLRKIYHWRLLYDPDILKAFLGCSGNPELLRGFKGFFTLIFSDAVHPPPDELNLTGVEYGEEEMKFFTDTKQPFNRRFVEAVRLYISQDGAFVTDRMAIFLSGLYGRLKNESVGSHGKEEDLFEQKALLVEAFGLLLRKHGISVATALPALSDFISLPNIESCVLANDFLFREHSLLQQFYNTRVFHIPALFAGLIHNIDYLDLSEMFLFQTNIGIFLDGFNLFLWMNLAVLAECKRAIRKILHSVVMIKLRYYRADDIWPLSCFELDSWEMLGSEGYPLLYLNMFLSAKITVSSGTGDEHKKPNRHQYDHNNTAAPASHYSNEYGILLALKHDRFPAQLSYTSHELSRICLDFKELERMGYDGIRELISSLTNHCIMEPKVAILFYRHFCSLNPANIRMGGHPKHLKALLRRISENKQTIEAILSAQPPDTITPQILDIFKSCLPTASLPYCATHSSSSGTPVRSSQSAQPGESEATSTKQLNGSRNATAPGDTSISMPSRSGKISIVLKPRNASAAAQPLTQQNGESCSAVSGDSADSELSPDSSISDNYGSCSSMPVRPSSNQAAPTGHIKILLRPSARSGISSTEQPSSPFSTTGSSHSKAVEHPGGTLHGRHQATNKIDSPARNTDGIDNGTAKKTTSRSGVQWSVGQAEMMKKLKMASDGPAIPSHKTLSSSHGAFSAQRTNAVYKPLKSGVAHARKRHDILDNESDGYNASQGQNRANKQNQTHNKQTSTDHPKVGDNKPSRQELLDNLELIRRSAQNINDRAIERKAILIDNAFATNKKASTNLGTDKLTVDRADKNTPRKKCSRQPAYLGDTTLRVRDIEPLSSTLFEDFLSFSDWKKASDVTIQKKFDSYDQYYGIFNSLRQAELKASIEANITVAEPYYQSAVKNHSDFLEIRSDYFPFVECDLLFFCSKQISDEQSLLEAADELAKDDSGGDSHETCQEHDGSDITASESRGFIGLVTYVDMIYSCGFPEYIVQISVKKNNLHRNGLFYYKQVMSLTSSLREFQALSGLKNSPLLSFILDPSHRGERRKPVFPALNGSPVQSAIWQAQDDQPEQSKPALTNLYGSTAADMVNNPLEPSLSNLNSIQADIIRGCCSSSDRFALIQGPPGTGKTTIVLGLVATLRHGFNSKKKILICTPSNTAIDEIVLRLAADYTRRTGLEPAAPDRAVNFLIRVGACTNKSIGKYTLEYLAMENTLCPKHKYRHTVLSNTAVICSTLSSCVLNYVQGLSFDYLIIDEACQATELSAIIPFKYDFRKIIMIGDPQQLPPTVISKNKVLEYSLFERLSAEYPPSMLKIQYRMHDRICQISSNLFYGGQLITDQSRKKKSKKYNLQPTNFVHITSGSERQDGNNSYYNTREAEVVLKIYDRLCSKYNNKLQISIITPYKAQVAHLKRFAKKNCEINTVDGYQGKESDVVMLSTVRHSGLGFVCDFRRINVAITRARVSVIILGNYPCLLRNKTWAKIINMVQGNRRYNSTSIEEFLKTL